MFADYDISLARANDIPGILVLQEMNLAERGGSLSVRQTGDWFRHAMHEKSLVVGRYENKVVGYVLGTSLAANTHVTIIQTMLRAFPPTTRLLSLRPYLCSGNGTRKGPSWRAIQYAANAHGGAPRYDIRTGRQHCLSASTSEMGNERTRRLHKWRRLLCRT
jgi:hypothetical protein